MERYGENLSWFQGSEDTEADYANLMYFRDGQDAEGRGYYQPITMTTRGSFLTYYIKFRYTPQAGGNTVYFNRENESYIGGNSPWYKNFLNGCDAIVGVNCHFQEICHLPSNFDFYAGPNISVRRYVGAMAGARYNFGEVVGAYVQGYYNIAKVLKLNDEKDNTPMSKKWGVSVGLTFNLF